MARLIKCYKCGKEFPSEQLKTISGKKYCPDCYALQEGYSDLMDYIIQSPYLYAGDTRNCSYVGRMLKSIRKDNPTWTYRKMLNTLKYIYDTPNNGLHRVPEFDPDYGFTWIIEKYYAIAQDAIHEEVERINQFNQTYSPEKITEIINTPPKFIEIQPDDYERDLEERQERIRTYLYGPEMDLSDIEEE